MICFEEGLDLCGGGPGHSGAHPEQNLDEPCHEADVCAVVMDTCPREEDFITGTLNGLKRRFHEEGGVWFGWMGGGGNLKISLRLISCSLLHGVTLWD